MATLLCGRKLANKILNEIKYELNILNESLHLKPTLGIVQVGHCDVADAYYYQQIKAARYCGISVRTYSLPPTSSFADIAKLIEIINKDSSVHAITVQTPVLTDEDINIDELLNHIDPNKDVDGMSAPQIVQLCSGGYLNWQKCPFLVHIRCAAAACLLLLQETGQITKGLQCLVVGRGKLVGIPVAHLMIWSAGATTTICHRDTRFLEEEVKRAEVLVTGAGNAEFIPGEWIRPGAIVIDCGMNRALDGTNRFCGDVKMEQETLRRAKWITPVPGGVGPLTVALLMRNTLNAAKRSHKLRTHPPLLEPTGIFMDN